MNTRKIAGTGIFTALTIVFTLISNAIPMEPRLNLSLIPIAMAGILYGPLSGFFVGLINGAFVMTSASWYFAIDALGTVLICLLKTSLAGLSAGLLYLLIKKKNDLAGMIVGSIAVPIINTALFILGSLIFFNKDNHLGDILAIGLLFNFLFEFGSALILAPALSKVIIKLKKNNKNKLDM